MVWDYVIPVDLTANCCSMGDAWCSITVQMLEKFAADRDLLTQHGSERAAARLLTTALRALKSSAL